MGYHQLGLIKIVLLLFFTGGPFAFAGGITTTRLVSGLNRPVFATAPQGDTDRLFIVHQDTGFGVSQISILDLNTNLILAQPFLQISLRTSWERGLLGLAFHPEYSNALHSGYGRFYIYYSFGFGGSGVDHVSRISEFQVSGNPDIADPNSERVLMEFDQPQGNHNGGWLGFSPEDHYLYISTGDGGGQNDSDSGHTPGLGNSQDLSNLLGCILRIDVDGNNSPNGQYGIPASNPFVNAFGEDEIWSYGLRNPWRCSFDRLTGDLYIADVGQEEREEVNVQLPSSLGGENYGWRVMEGTRCHTSGDPLDCFDPNFIDPVHEYEHVGAPNGGESITGGYVYRGPIASLRGHYLFGDFSSNQIWSFRYSGQVKSEFQNRTSELTPDVGSISSISSFGEDAVGNLYILDLFGGEVFKVIPSATWIDADFDCDGDVDLDDLLLLVSDWLGSTDAYDIAPELGDQKINLLDFSQFVSSWLEGL